MSGLRTGVIGAGVFGGYHAGKYAAHPDVAFIGVCDLDMNRAKALADDHGVRAFSDPEMLFASVDAVTIASAAQSHGPLAARALEAGLHVLVEKPVAATVSEAETVVALAERSRLVLQVGHQERFVFRALGVLDVHERPRRITARRLGPYSERGSDVSVSLDLMTHDIDLARLLAGRSDAAAITAQSWAEHGTTPDRVVAHVRFDNGVEASFEASRLADERDRLMRIEYESGAVEIDFVAKRFANDSSHDLNPDFLRAPEAKDSLGAGVDAFVQAVLGRGPVAISGADGLEAVRIAAAADAAAARVGLDAH